MISILLGLIFLAFLIYAFCTAREDPRPAIIGLVLTILLANFIFGGKTDVIRQPDQRSISSLY